MLLSGCFTFLLLASAAAEMAADEAKSDDYVVVADAIFRGDYVGIVRMEQKIGDGNDGARMTKVTVNLKHKGDLDRETNNHMWHVEHDPVTGVDCADENKHFAPLGITKAENYTVYCSVKTPDFCEIGDISGKSGLTSLGQGPMEYSVPRLPVVGPLTVVGHSVNIHEENMVKVRRACANIELNKKMTRARLVEVNVKMQGNQLDGENILVARTKMAGSLKISVSRIQIAQRLDTLNGCTKLTFLIFGDRMYCEQNLKALKVGKIDIGPLTAVNCWVDGAFVGQPGGAPSKVPDGMNERDSSSEGPNKALQQANNFDWDRYADIWNQYANMWEQPKSTPCQNEDGWNRNGRSADGARFPRPQQGYNGWQSGPYGRY